MLFRSPGIFPGAGSREPGVGSLEPGAGSRELIFLNTVIDKKSVVFCFLSILFLLL